LELKLPGGGPRFLCQLVQRVTERWGIKFAGVAIVTHPSGKHYTVYLPGVLTFDPAGMTGDPHSSERVGPACDRILVSIAVTQLCVLQWGGTTEDLDAVDAAFDELVAMFTGRFVLAAWLRHQVEQACLKRARAKPYNIFIKDLIANSALAVQRENRRVTREYLSSIEQSTPVVCEAYLMKVSHKDRGCFGRSYFQDIGRHHELAFNSESDEEAAPFSPVTEGSAWTATMNRSQSLESSWTPMLADDAGGGLISIGISPSIGRRSVCSLSEAPSSRRVAGTSGAAFDCIRGCLTCFRGYDLLFR
jgi:hypothetical protein